MKFFSLISLLVLFSCNSHDYPIRYEQQGGNPDIDYIVFLNDSVCEFQSPDNRRISAGYTLSDGVYTVYVAPMVTATLKHSDKNTLVGSVPFFEGTWEKK